MRRLIRRARKLEPRRWLRNGVRWGGDSILCCLDLAWSHRRQRPGLSIHLVPGQLAPGLKGNGLERVSLHLLLLLPLLLLPLRSLLLLFPDSLGNYRLRKKALTGRWCTRLRWIPSIGIPIRRGRFLMRTQLRSWRIRFGGRGSFSRSWCVRGRRVDGSR